jgi:hypothetical protein
MADVIVHEIEVAPSGRAIYDGKVYDDLKAAQMARAKDVATDSIVAIVEKEIPYFDNQQMVTEFLLSDEAAKIVDHLVILHKT